MNIKKITDYRDFLKIRCDLMKSTSKNFSFQTLALKLKTTKSYLKLVIDKKRHISVDKIIPLSELFGFDQFETQYFVFLFLKNTAKDSKIKEFFASILRSYSATDRQFRSTVANEFTDQQNYIFRDWISMAILALMNRADYQNNASWILETLGGPKILKITDVERSLVKIENGGAIALTQQTAFINHVNPTEIEEYQRFKTGLSRAALALDSKGKNSLHRPNRFQMYCLGLSKEDATELIQLYDQLDQKIIEIANRKTKTEKVMFVSNNVFSVAVEE